MIAKEPVIHDFTEQMRSHYGNRLAKIILFGSYARGDFHEESDIDFLVLLNDEQVSMSKESEFHLEKRQNLMEKYGLWIDTFVTSLNQYLTSNRAIFRFIRKDGITVYE